VTHDIDEALLLADKVFVLSKRPSTVLDVIDVPFARPRTGDLQRSLEFFDLRNKVLSLLDS